MGKNSTILKSPRHRGGVWSHRDTVLTLTALVCAIGEGYRALVLVVVVVESSGVAQVLFPR